MRRRKNNDDHNIAHNPRRPFCMRKKENCRRGGFAEKSTVPDSYLHGRRLHRLGIRAASGSAGAGTRRSERGRHAPVHPPVASDRASGARCSCIEPDDTFYQHVSPSDAAEIVSSHIIGTQPSSACSINTPQPARSTEKMGDVEFFKRQTKIVLANCGLIDPLSIEDYIGREGYAGSQGPLRHEAG